MSSTPVTLDFSKAQPIQLQPQGGGVTLDFSKAQPIEGAKPPAQSSWLDQARDFGRELWNQTGAGLAHPVQSAEAVAGAVNHPIRTYMADAANRQEILDKAEAAFKRGDYGEGVAHALYGIVPFFGPQLEKAGENFQEGKYGAGAGTSVGIGLNLAGPEALGDIKASLPEARSLAAKMYQSALKPSTTLSAAERARAVGTGLEYGIPVSESGVKQIGGLIDDLNSKIAAEVANSPKTVNKFQVASRLSPTAQRFATQVTPESDLNAVAETGNEFLRNQPNEIPAAQAQAIKQGTYQQLSSKSYGELRSATIESQKALARGIKEELANQFPELSKLNAQDSRLLQLQPLIERAINRIGNRNILSLGGKVAGAGGAAAGGAPGAAAAMILHEVVGMPELQSKLAIALTKVSKGAVTIGQAQSRVASYLNALRAATTTQGIPQAATATAGP